MPKILKLLIQRGATANIKDPDGNTPLHLAVKTGSLENTQILLEFGGANPDTLNILGYNPLMEAIEEGDKEMVELLLKWMKVETVKRQLTLSGLTAKELALDLGYDDIAELL